jgi:hypothetical protein
VAEAGLILQNLAARLEAAPLQNGLQTAFFHKLFKRCDKSPILLPGFSP